MTAISYHDTVNDLQDLDWSGGTPFARLDWFRLLEESGKAPFLAMARSSSDAVALPLQRSGAQIESLTNWYAFTWEDMLTSDAPTGLLEDIAHDLTQHTSRVELFKVPEEGGTVDRLANAFRKAGWFVLRSASDTNHILPVDGRSFADYLTTRPGQVRTTLKRKAKKVDVALSTSFSPEDWAAYEDIYADSWKPEEGDPAMLRRFAEAESAAGRYRFGLARHEGDPVAAQFWTVENGTAFIHKLAHRQSAKSVSPGTTLTATLFEHVIDKDHVELVDFGTGDDPYKRDWMEAQRTRWQLTCLRPGAPSNWPRIAKAAMRKLVSRKLAG